MAKKKIGKALVIDACVARSAGETSAYPASVQCRQCLLAIRDHKHYVVTTQSIKEEWRKHASTFSRRWLVNMTATKRVRVLDSKEIQPIAGLVDYLAQKNSKSDLEAVFKDIHLLEAASMTENRVISSDNKMAEILSNTALEIAALRAILWANPTKLEEKAVEWIADGAPWDPGRSLGQYHNNS